MHPAAKRFVGGIKQRTIYICVQRICWAYHQGVRKTKQCNVNCSAHNCVQNILQCALEQLAAVKTRHTLYFSAKQCHTEQFFLWHCSSLNTTFLPTTVGWFNSHSQRALLKPSWGPSDFHNLILSSLYLMKGCVNWRRRKNSFKITKKYFLQL